VSAHLLDERRQQVFERELAAVDMRFGERAAGREGLERLQKTAIHRVINEALDGPRPRLKTQILRRARVLLPKAHRRAEGGMGLAGDREWQRAGAASLCGCSDHRIGGAKVEAKAEWVRGGRAGHKDKYATVHRRAA